MSDINIGLVQTPASFRYKEEIFNKVELMLDKEEINFNLICLPELFASNINLINLDDIGEELNGETFQFLSKIAKEKGSFVIGGIIEKEGGDYYNTAIFIDDKGELIGKHRKIVLNEFENSFLNGGVDINFFETKIGKIAIIIGNDINSLHICNEIAINDVDIMVYITQTPYEFSCIIQQTAISRVMEIPTYLLISTICGTSNISRIEFKGLTSILYNSINEMDIFDLNADKYIMKAMPEDECGVMSATININKVKELKEEGINIINHKEITRVLQKA